MFYLFIEHRRSVDRRLKYLERRSQQLSAPLRLVFGRQIRIAHRIMELIAAHDPVSADLCGHIGKTGDEHDGNAFPLDLFCNRSAATRAGSSRCREHNPIDSRN